MSKYKVGEKVKIVSERTRLMNPDGKMDKYLGTTMTIKEVDGNRVNPYKMEEDEDVNIFHNSRWNWGDEMIEGLVTPKVEVHPDFKKWYGDICDHWENPESQKEFAIVAINQMGFGKGLVNNYGEKIPYTVMRELGEEMQFNKEKYTRAILDDNWEVRVPKNPKYFVMFPKLNEGENNYLNKQVATGELSTQDYEETEDYQTQFTKEEIIAIDSRYWEFREDVK